MVSMRSKKPICAPPSLSQKFPQCRLWNRSGVRLIDDDPLSSLHGKLSSASSFHASPLQVIEGLMSLALYPQVVSQVSQAPQHFISAEKQATCEGCFARQSLILLGHFLSLPFPISLYCLLLSLLSRNEAFTRKLSIIVLVKTRDNGFSPFYSSPLFSPSFFCE